MLEPVEETVVLEWTFTPLDYFETVLHTESDAYSVDVDHGKVIVRANPMAYTDYREMRDAIHKVVDAGFQGVSVLSHQPYQLVGPTVRRLHADGRRDEILFAADIIVRESVGTPDIQVRDRNRTVLSDSRRDRLECKARFAKLAMRYSQGDPTLALSLVSWQAAMRDPADELVHLFEIRDALAKEFGGEVPARTALGISHKDWKQLGKLANDEPLRQGRHRGAHADQLRNATEAELAQARRIARGMLLAYMRHLEQHQP